MENSEINTTQNETISCNREIKLYLSETAKWGNLLAIIGYVFMGLMILVSLVMIIGFSQMSDQVGFPMWILGLLYLVMAGVYYFPVTYLYRFSDKMKLAIKRQDEKLYTSGFANLKSLFKFFGIFTIAMLVLYGLALVIIIPMSIFLK